MVGGVAVYLSNNHHQGAENRDMVVEGVAQGLGQQGVMGQGWWVAWEGGRSKHSDDFP